MPRINIGMLTGGTKKTRRWKNVQNVLVVRQRDDTDTRYLQKVIAYVAKNYPGYSLQGFCPAKGGRWKGHE